MKNKKVIRAIFKLSSFKGLTMIEVLASIIIFSLIILALMSTAYYIFSSFDEISIKGIIRRKVDEYYHSHIFTKYYLYNDYYGPIPTTDANTNITTNANNNTSINISVSYITNSSSSITTIGNNTVTTISNQDEFNKRLNYDGLGIKLAPLLKDMIVAFNNDEWVKSQGITITSLSATLLATIGFYKVEWSKREIYLASTLDKIKLDFNFEKRNRHQFSMSFEFYIVNNMKMSKSFGIYRTSLATSIQTLSNGSNVFSLTHRTTTNNTTTDSTTTEWYSDWN
jgi:hypothetical protein